MKQYLEIAKIINTHGIRGDMKLDIWCDGPETIKALSTLYLTDTGERPLSVSDGRMHGKFMLIHAEGIDTPEEAAKYKGKTLYANRDHIPLAKGACFIADLIGLPVVDADTGTVYGTLTDVTENPANDLYEVKTKTQTVLIPAIPQFVRRVDAEEGIFVTPIPGMFTEAVWHDGDAPSDGAPKAEKAKAQTEDEP